MHRTHVGLSSCDAWRAECPLEAVASRRRATRIDVAAELAVLAGPAGSLGLEAHPADGHAVPRHLPSAVLSGEASPGRPPANAAAAGPHQPRAAAAGWPRCCTAARAVDAHGSAATTLAMARLLMANCAAIA